MRDRKIRNLLITIPPRHTKSDTVAVLYPAWEWIDQPSHKFLFGSYALSLAARDQMRTKALCNSQWYQDRWPLLVDGNTRRLYTGKSGERFITAVDAGATGEGGDTIIIDDPHNIQDVLRSDTTREATLQWLDQVMSTRLNDPKTGAKVMILQRSHANDAAGHVLKQGGWEHLNLPSEFEEKRRCRTSIGFVDPRTKEGELLNPSRFGPEEIADAKIRLGSYGYAGQHQQRPAPAGGGVIKLEWFNRFNAEPALFDFIGISVDTATSGNTSAAYSSAGVYLETKQGTYLIDLWRERVEYPDLKRKVWALCDKYRPNVIVIEDKSSGRQLLQEAGNRPVFAFEPEGDKVARLSLESPYVEARNVWLPESAPWLFDFETEMEAVPNAPYMDQADQFSQWLKYRRTKPLGKVTVVKLRGH